MNRRNALGGLAAIAVAALGGAAWKLHWFAKRYTPTPYDDLLNQIVDRMPAARLGAAALRTMPGFDIKQLASRLRQPGHELAARAPLDAGQHRLTEVGGWLVPQSVALYAALAARA